MATRKNHLRIVAKSPKPDPSQRSSRQPAHVSPRWLITAIAIALAGAAFCGWATLCLLFWQGSWQLLYQPTAGNPVVPSGVGFEVQPVSFAAAETGQLRIHGWWIPAETAPSNRLTVLYLHGAKGNLGDSAKDLARLHGVGVNILAFDYRGYGQSEFAHPSERGWLQDAAWAFDYLVQTRHIDPHSIVIAGKELGADLAVEFAAAHPEMAGVIVDSPIENPVSVIFGDSRAKLVPARLLVKDRYDMDAAASRIQVPSLWLLPSSAAANAGEPTAFRRTLWPKQLVRLNDGQDSASAITKWLASLPRR